MKIEQIEIGESYGTKIGARNNPYGYEIVKVERIVRDDFAILVSWSDGQKTWLYPENLFSLEEYIHGITA